MVGATSGYLPFRYTRTSKRPGQRYLLHHVVLEDGLLLWLAAVSQVPSALVLAVVVASLHASFWTVYELGYRENDVDAAAREARPHRAGTVVPVPAGPAWACAAVLAVPGVLLLHGSGAAPDWLPGPASGTAALGVLAAVWGTYLLAARGTYWVYNHLPESARSLPYAVLQLFRTLGYGLLLPLGTAGALALGAVVLTRWLAYASYRDSGVPWRGSHRLLLLWSLLVLLPVGLVADPRGVLRWETAAVLLFFTVRAHRPLRDLVRDVRRGQQEPERAAGGRHG